MDIEARVKRISPSRGKASVHIRFDADSSMTVSNISVWEADGRIMVKLPPMGCRPDVSFAGELRRQVESAIRTRFAQEPNICATGAVYHSRKLMR